MLLSQKLKVLPILTYVGVGLMTASFVSPGWVSFKVNVLKYRSFTAPLSNENTFAISLHMTAGVWFYTICVYKFKRGTNEYYDVYPEAEKICVTRPNSYEYEQRLSDGSAFGKSSFFFFFIHILVFYLWINPVSCN